MYVCIYLCVFNMVLITGPNGPTSWTGHQFGLEKIPKIGKIQLKTESQGQIRFCLGSVFKTVVFTLFS